MRIYRFDPEVSIPISSSGSRFNVSALTGDASRVQVSVLYLPVDGRMGPRVTTSGQFVGVLAGSGWVGDDRGTRRRRVEVGYGVLWLAGETQQVDSPDGMTAICVEGQFDVWAMRVTQEIVVSEYDPEWPRWFDQVSRFVWPVVADVALRIDHVGSTSVPGLAAKPIIDIDIVVRCTDDVAPVVRRLETAGYRWLGDLGVAGRQAFEAPLRPALPRHHLYVVVEDSKAYLDHWLLRDWLRSDAVARDRYAELKRRNVVLADGNMDVYVAAKASFVGDLLARARAERGLPPAVYWDPNGERS